MNDEDALEDLDALVRRTDEDRWLSSRYVADATARADLTALYAFDREITRAPQVASNPLIGEIRLTWWREAVEEAFGGGRVRRHPVVEALAGAARRGAFSRERLEAAIDARYDDLEPQPFADAAALDGWLDAAHGSIMVDVALRLDRATEPHALRAAARAWGLSRLDPARLPPGFERDAGLRDRLAVARADTARLSPYAFPAVAHATLVRRPDAGPFGRRWALWTAVLRGRI